MSKRTWIIPFLRQSFVCSGVSLNLIAHGLAVSYVSVLLPQLRARTSDITIDDGSGSWIASSIGISMIIGILTSPVLMAKFGRKPAHLVSIAPMTAGWAIMMVANSVAALIIGRLFQGLSMGLSVALGPILIGEYSSPINRGVFLTTISLFISAGVILVHSVGAYVSWRRTALMCGCISLLNLVIVFLSPESPSWLANQGRYKDCERIYRWLRGDEEDEELFKLVAATKTARKSNAKAIATSFKNRAIENYSYFSMAIKKKEVYKPVIVMSHMYGILQWGGANILVSYTTDIFEDVIGAFNIPLLILSMDIQRVASNTVAMFLIKKLKRRLVFLTTSAISIFAFLATAVYLYCRNLGIVPNYPLIGFALTHLLMFSVATGSVPLSFIFAGELYSLEYKSISCIVSSLFYAINLSLSLKSFPFLSRSLGISGAYCVYACIMVYCVCVIAYLLPETKDRTLQDIEEEYKGKNLPADELICAQPLTDKLQKGNNDKEREDYDGLVKLEA